MYGISQSIYWCREVKKHFVTGGVFLCPLVRDEDFKLFRKNLFSNQTKVDQDKFLLLNITSNPAVRKRVSHMT